MATFRISEDDYVATHKLCARLTKRQWVINLSIGLVLVLMAVFGPPALQVGALVGLIVGGLVTAVTHLVVVPNQVRQHYRNYQVIKEEVTLDLQDNGIRYSSDSGVAVLTWDKILKWRENEKFVLIYLMPSLYYIVPKEVEKLGFDLGELTRKLTQHVGAAV
jgi:hypothetical protein